MTSSDKFWCWIVCTMIGSCSGVSAVGSYANAKKDARTACVERAWSQSDRLECLKAK